MKRKIDIQQFVKSQLHCVITSLLLAFSCFSSSVAANTELTVTVRGNVINETCDIQADPTMTLDEAYTSDLSTTEAKNVKEMKVSLLCGGAVKPQVNIYVAGEASDAPSAFKNQAGGGAQHVALRLQDADGNIVSPNTTVTGINTVSGGSQDYIFKAGYLATGAGAPGEGAFQTTITLTVKYI